jgi:hypothetical protein
MTRIKLTDLAGIRRLTEREQADVRGGLSWLAIGGVAAAGFGIYALGSHLVAKGYIKRINNKVQQLFRMAPQVNRTRRTNCITWSDGERNCYA